MADAKKCDRCGGYYTPFVPSGNPLEMLAVSLSEVSGFRVEAVAPNCDLCPDCKKSFERWFDMKEGDTDGKERSE